MPNWMPLDWITRHVGGVVRQGLPFEHIMAASLIELRHGDNRDLVEEVVDDVCAALTAAA